MDATNAAEQLVVSDGGNGLEIEATGPDGGIMRDKDAAAIIRTMDPLSGLECMSADSTSSSLAVMIDSGRLPDGPTTIEPDDVERMFDDNDQHPAIILGP